MENNEKNIDICRNKFKKDNRDYLFQIFEAFTSNNIDDEDIDYIVEKLQTGEEIRIARMALSRDIPKDYIDLLIENFRENPEMDIPCYKIYIIESDTIERENLIKIIKDINHLKILGIIEDICGSLPQERIDRFVNICLSDKYDFKSMITVNDYDSRICDKINNDCCTLIEIEKVLKDNLSDREVDYILGYDTREEIEMMRYIFKYKTPIHWIPKILEIDSHWGKLDMIKLISYNKIDDIILEKIFNLGRNDLAGILVDACKHLSDKKLNKFIQIYLQKNNLYYIGNYLLK